ncbi:MAG: hypothetical protein ABIE36_02450 [Candidatus Diapherotrites archaeon]
MVEIRYMKDIPLHVMFVSPNIEISELEKGLDILRNLKIGIRDCSIKSDLNVKFEGKGVVTIYSNLIVDYEGIENIRDCKVSHKENCVVINKNFLGDEFSYRFYKKWCW